MSVIRGKLEAKREVLPQRVVFGKTPFVREGQEWQNSENPKAKPKSFTSLNKYIEAFKGKKTGLQTG